MILPQKSIIMRGKTTATITRKGKPPVEIRSPSLLESVVMKDE